MHDEANKRGHELASELVALEKELQALSPAAPRIDRDRFMFEAGRAAELGPSPMVATRRAASRGWFWPAATAMMTAASLLLATMLVLQNRPQSVAQQTAKPGAAVEVVSTPRDANPAPIDRFATRDAWSMIRPATGGYLGIRYIALTRGVGALPPDFESPSSERNTPDDGERAKPVTARGLLDELLPASKGPNSTRS